MFANDRQRFVFNYLDQGTIWFARGGVHTYIADMDPEWRYNASRMLERKAERLAEAYGWAELDWMARIGPMSEHVEDQFDREIWDRDHDPLAWIRRTTLYRALTANLPTKPKKLRRLAERARHYSMCPGRTGARLNCQCTKIAAQMQAGK